MADVAGALWSFGPEPGLFSSFVLFGVVIGLRPRYGTLNTTDYRQNPFESTQQTEAAITRAEIAVIVVASLRSRYAGKKARAISLRKPERAYKELGGVREGGDGTAREG